MPDTEDMGGRYLKNCPKITCADLGKLNAQVMNGQFLSLISGVLEKGMQNGRIKKRLL